MFTPAGCDELRRDVSAFIGQKAVHSRVHEAVWAQRRDLGVPVDRYAELIQAFQSTLDPFVPPKLKLATTAALEHFTAAFGRAFLGEDIDDIVGTEMADLLRWHGAEEIEHRSVAFDVLGVVDDGIPLRLAGLVLGATLLTIVPSAGVVLFAADELRGRRAWVPRPPNPKLLAMAARFAVAIGAEVARYAAPSFHPADDDPPSQYHAWLTGWHGSGRTD